MLGTWRYGVDDVPWGATSEPWCDDDAKQQIWSNTVRVCPISWIWITAWSQSFILNRLPCIAIWQFSKAHTAWTSIALTHLGLCEGICAVWPQFDFNQLHEPWWALSNFVMSAKYVLFANNNIAHRFESRTFCLVFLTTKNKTEVRLNFDQLIILTARQSGQHCPKTFSMHVFTNKCRVSFFVSK